MQSQKLEFQEDGSILGFNLFFFFFPCLEMIDCEIFLFKGNIIVSLPNTVSLRGS